MKLFVLYPRFIDYIADYSCFQLFRKQELDMYFKLFYTFLKIGMFTIGLRPATVGLIVVAALILMNHENFIDYISLVIFGVAFLLAWKLKIHSIFIICIAGVTGLIIY